MARVLIVGGLLALAFAVYAAVDCVLTERFRVRALPKPGWIALILLLPVVGALLWFAIGRATGARAPLGRPTGPDDDPEFLRSARPAPTASVDEPDWQRLEQELVDLDSDTDDDADGRRR